jgi:murein DD-endopeptidase MepM/ murein hydrolase activator NlpD
VRPALAVELDLSGQATQGGMLLGRVAAGARVALEGKPVRVTPEGAFIIGFGRDHGPSARLDVTTAEGTRREMIEVTPRTWDIQRIDGLPPAKVNPDTRVQPRIAAEAERMRAVRRNDRASADFTQPFRWPAQGRVSGVFGSQRILNGEARQPHYGLDVAGAVGTPVLAASAGVVTLADPDLYFTGGTLAIDHGHGLVSIYAHLSRLDVKVGQQVAAGDAVGAIGATGRATGPHLHWSLSWFDERLDPALVLPARTAAQP